MSTTTTTEKDNGHDLDRSSRRKRKVAIIGGGLAGLSTAFHLLNKTHDSHVTIYDRAPVGSAGASSVAGGLVHPLSPRGKLVHWGIEGLTATNRLIDAACEASAAASGGGGSADDDDDNNKKSQASAGATASSIVLRDELYRVALTPQHVKQLQTSARLLPSACEWLDPADLNRLLLAAEGVASPEGRLLGGIRLTNGCKVIHVPSYLKGLWKACEFQAQKNDSAITWSILGETSSLLGQQQKNDWEGELLDSYDTVVYAAGSGMFESSKLRGPFGDQTTNFPIQLVRGQSVELELRKSPNKKNQQQQQQQQALLCGKYVSPMPDPSLVLVGATHEFQKEPLDQHAVVEELKQRTFAVAPHLWDDDNDMNIRQRVHRVTSGTRVQSERGKYGRMPIIGRLPRGDQERKNAWIFTGLSSRGLLYHGIYGDILTDAILEDAEETIFSRYEGLDWWKKRMAAQ